MGCFDTLKIVCPACGAENEVQSKAGRCNLTSYSVADAPADILVDVAEHGTFTCEECGALFRLRVTIHSVVERC